MKNLTWQNPAQLFVAQELINKVKSKCCGIKVIEIGYNAIKILENQKLANDVSMAEQEMLKDKINSIISKLDDKQEPQA